jgi:eukaryotic-like serine/threonine-protein kinase
MAQTPRPWLPQGHILFTRGDESLLGAGLDARSDLFSLGLVLLELATWNPLYHLDSAEGDVLPRTLSPALTTESGRT